MSAVSPDVRADDLAVRLVEEAARHKTFSGTRELVRICAEAFGVDGCILWQVAEGEEPLKERSLIAAAQYFHGEQDPVWNQVPIDRFTRELFAGSRNPRVVTLEDVARRQEELNLRGDPDIELFQSLGWSSFATIPIYRDTEPWGALNLYARRALPPDSATDSQIAAARLFPFLVQDIATQTGVEVLNSVRRELRKSEKSHYRAERIRRETLQTVVELIKNAFGALEVSIYLERVTGGPRRLELEATAWPWAEDLKRATYSPGEGLTGYCFERRRPVRIPDLVRLQNGDQDHVLDRYDGLAPRLDFPIDEAVRSLLPRSRDGRNPPISWLGVPLVDDNALGVLRVCGLRSGPYYFDHLREELLLLVADQVAEWIVNRTRLAKAYEENEWLKKVVKGVAGLNLRVHEGLTAEKFQRDRILNEALNVASEAIPNASSFSIRLVDEAGANLQFAAVLGREWELGSKKETEERMALKFPLAGPESDSMGAKVFQTNKVLYQPDVERNGWRRRPFLETESMIIAPVSSGRIVYGTMEAHSNHRGFFTEQAVHVLELLGRQLGLYLFLADRLRDLRSTQKALSEALEAERETFENLVHQLKTPIYLSVRRSTRIVANARNRSFDLPWEAVALRADCRRSERVLGNVALFADLARGEKIGVHRSPLTLKYLIPYLHELVNEHALLVNPEHRITFVVVEPSFSLLDQVLVQVDLHLLDQMLGNLLDNAVKYSWKQAQIVIKGGRTRHQQSFYIGVTNRGVPIAPEEAKRLAERGSRSDRALNKEGSGLGLYLVRQMLDAHGGTLEIQPTNSNGVTEVRLLLPCAGRVPEV